MSLLHKPSIERLASSHVDGAKLVQLFETLAADAVASEEGALDLAVYYIDTDDDFTEGEFVPELHLVVRRINPDDIGDNNDT